MKWAVEKCPRLNFYAYRKPTNSKNKSGYSIVGHPVQYYIITEPKLGGGGVRGASAKSQSIAFFKPSLLENGVKIVQRRVVLLKLIFLLSLRTHESMEIQFSTDGIHRK